MGLSPDVVAFGKKAQVCGIMAGRRVDMVETNVFNVSSRINSTWGGNLVDMVRSRKILEVIENNALVENAASLGSYLGVLLEELARDFPIITNPRGRGLMRAVSIENTKTRNMILQKLLDDESIIMLGCGERSIRFRPALTITQAELDLAIAGLRRVLTALV